MASIWNSFKKKLEEGTNEVRDWFDANTQADRWRRVSQGRPATYEADQQARGYTNDNNSIQKRISNTVKTVGRGIAEPYNYLGKGIAETLAYDSPDVKQAREAQDRALAGFTANIGAANKKIADPTVSPEEKARWQKVRDSAFIESQRIAGEKGRRAQEVIEATDPVKGAASVVSIGSDIATAGLGTAATKGGAKGLITQGIKSGAANVPGGIVEPYISKGDKTTAKDVAISTGLAFGVGAAVPGATELVKGGKNKLKNLFTEGAEVIDDTPARVSSTTPEPEKVAQPTPKPVQPQPKEPVIPPVEKLEVNLPEPLQPVEPKTVKVKKTGVVDNDLTRLTKERDAVVDAAAEGIMAKNPTRNLRAEVLQNGGISSSAYEDLPNGVVRKEGMSADKMAQTLGFDSEDAFVQALNEQGNVVSRKEARRIAEEQLAAGQHPFSSDYQSLTKDLMARQDELSLYPTGKRDVVRVTKRGPQAPTEEELLALQNTPEGQTGPRTTKYTEKRGKPIRDKAVDAEAQRMLAAGATNDEVANFYMQRQGMVYGDALKEADRIAGYTSPPSVKKVIKEGEPRTVEGKPMKDAGVKSTMENLAIAQNIGNVDARLTSSNLEKVARENGIDLADPDFIARYQLGQLQGDAEKTVGRAIKEETDRIFRIERQIDPNIEYRRNYLPQAYAEDPAAVEEAIRGLRTKTGASNQRTFRTYDEARAFGLTPKYASISEMIGDSARRAQTAFANRRVVENSLQDGIFSTDVLPGWKAVEGFNIDGAPVYASPKVANTINNALQEATDNLSKSVKGLAKFNATWQDIMLSGGIPYTPANFFVFGQVAKEVTAGRLSVLQDFVYSLSDEMTQKRFIDTRDFVQDMAERGVPFNLKSGIGLEGQSKLAYGWDSAISKPTFERFMPNQYLSVAEQAYKRAVSKGMSEEAAKDLAASTVKQYYGIVDQIALGRSTNVQNAINAVFFAPKYRESIINTLKNTGEALMPQNWSNPAYHMNRRLAAGMAVTVVAAEMLQRKISGHGLLDNREGQEGSIEITIGKDEKGNDKVINIPLMPGFLTIPRAVIAGVGEAVRGDIPGVVKEGSKLLATPLQVGGQVIGNADYFGRPIYMDAETAAREGVPEDSTLTKLGKAAKYVAFQGMPGYGRAARDYVNDKSLLEVAAQAGELPVRFGKKLKPETEAYFNDREEVYQTLDKNGRAAWDVIHPKVKNVNGEYITDPTVDSGLARAAVYLNNPAVLDAENEMARRAKERGEKVDPLWELSREQQLLALRMETLPPQDPNKKKLRKDNPWLNELSDKRSAFFDSLPEGDPNKPKGPFTYPEPSAEVKNLQNAYYQLEDSAMKRDFLKNNPELTDQMAKEEQYSRAVRAAKMLPQYDKYPEPSPEVQKLIDEYTSQGPPSSPDRKAKERSAWIKANPDKWAVISEQFGKQSLWNLEMDAQMAAFEGEDLTDKGVKAIKSIAKSLDGGGSGGYGKGGSGDGIKTIRPDFGDVQEAPSVKVSKPTTTVKVEGRKRAKIKKVVRSKGTKNK